MSNCIRIFTRWHYQSTYSLLLIYHGTNISLSYVIGLVYWSMFYVGPKLISYFVLTYKVGYTLPHIYAPLATCGHYIVTRQSYSTTKLLIII